MTAPATGFSWHARVTSSHRPFRLFQRRLGGCRRPLGVRLLGVSQSGRGAFGLFIAGAAENHDGRLDAMLLQDQFGLQQLQLQTDRPQFLAQQEFGIGECQAVAVGLGLRRRLGGLRPCRVFTRTRQIDVMYVAALHSGPLLLPMPRLAQSAGLRRKT